MNVRYVVSLTEGERGELRELVAKGSALARRVKKAQILLAADGGASDDEIARLVVVGTSTVYRTKKRWVEEGLEAALSDRPRPGAERKLSAKEEALPMAPACTKPPPGRARWTLELLAGELVRLTEHESVSTETPGNIWPKSTLHGLISANRDDRDLAENPGIRVALVTAGTRCYRASAALTKSRSSPRCSWRRRTETWARSAAS